MAAKAVRLTKRSTRLRGRRSVLLGKLVAAAASELYRSAAGGRQVVRKVLGVVVVLGVLAGAFALAMAFVLKDDHSRREAYESAERASTTPAARMIGRSVDEGEIRAKTDARI